MNTKVPSMQELLEAGVHFGHQTRRGNPRMDEYIFGARDGVHIINLEHSERLLKEAAEAAFKLGEEGKTLMFVGTKKQAQTLVTDAAKSVGAPYLTERWVGGFLTNFEEVRKNVAKLVSLREEKVAGKLGRYTKKEQLLISRKIAKFEKDLGGIADMNNLPDAMFTVDCAKDVGALYEAKRRGVMIIGLVDSNANPALVDYPIPGNDDATKAIKVIVDTITASFAEGQKKGQAVKDKAQSDLEKKEAKEKSQAEVTLKEDEVMAAEELVEKETVKDSERVV